MLKNGLFFVCAWLSLGAGVVGIFLPVLPTTPFVLLSAFLFASSSKRYHRWLQTTKIYRRYVIPYQQAGGMTVGLKVRILTITWAVMAISGLFVHKTFVWVILALCALAQLIFFITRIPTVPKVAEQAVAEEDSQLKDLKQ
ncbi:MAG: YbaN family protein [Coriobacteriales bacterium]|nr:YbaN family protein [Coriobacteriales bacterium]